MENKHNKYPLIVYKDITYFPMTYHYADFLGLHTDWRNNTLTINKEEHPFADYSDWYAQKATNKNSYTATVATSNIVVNGKNIKNSQEKYAETAGIRHPDLESITHMVEYLKSGVVDYEFRTTVVKELHKREDIAAIGQWLSGSRRYFLQNYKESEQVIRPIFTSYSREQLENFQQILRKTITQVEIPGI